MRESNNEQSYYNNENVYKIESERDQLLGHLKSYLESFKESDDLFDRVSNKFIALENELQNVLKEKWENEKRLKEENYYLQMKYNKLLEENREIRQSKDLEINRLVCKINSMTQKKQEDASLHTISMQSQQEEEDDEDFFVFYQSNLNEANEKIQELNQSIKEYQERDYKIKKKDEQLKQLYQDVDTKNNENKMLIEKLLLSKKEISILESNIQLLNDELRRMKLKGNLVYQKNYLDN